MWDFLKNLSSQPAGNGCPALNGINGVLSGLTLARNVLLDSISDLVERTLGF